MAAYALGQLLPEDQQPFPMDKIHINDTRSDIVPNAGEYCCALLADVVSAVRACVQQPIPMTVTQEMQQSMHIFASQLGVRRDAEPMYIRISPRFLSFLEQYANSFRLAHLCSVKLVHYDENTPVASTQYVHATVSLTVDALDSTPETAALTGSNAISQDFLGKITLGGLPPHKLQLKTGVPIMLLSCMHRARGLAHGTGQECGKSTLA